MSDQGGGAVIFGGSSGIGLALARRLARRHSRLTLASRDADALQRAADDVAGIGGCEVDPVPCDITVPADVDAVLTRPSVRETRLLIAMAGRVSVGLVDDLDAAAFRADMETNYFGTLNVVRSALAHGCLAPGARLVLVSSGAGLVGVPGYAAYAPTKFAVRGLAEVLRTELKPKGLAVSVVYPPDTDTPQLRDEIPLRPASTAAVAGSGGVMTAEAVAEAIDRGVQAGRFAITPGLEMTALHALHSAIHPVWRWWCDRCVRSTRG